MPTRCQLIFSVSTVPTNLAVARVHVGSFSEGMWFSGTFDAPSLAKLTNLARTRARILPPSASITGFRATDYQIVGGRAVPGLTTTGNLQFPGVFGATTDIPQLALSVQLKSAGVSNVSKIMIHCLPDDYVRGGEFVGGQAIEGLINDYLTALTAGFYFLGRDRALGKFPINEILGNNLQVTGNPPWFVNDFIRMLRVRDVYNRPLRGSYRVTSAGVSTFGLAGLPAGLVVEGKGQARKETVALFPITSFQLGRATTRKIGRPSEAYRGRASRR